MPTHQISLPHSRSVSSTVKELRDENREGKRRSITPAADFTVESFCTRLQVHGLVDWYHAKSAAAGCFWLSVILLGFCITGLTVYHCAHSYYIDPVMTTVVIRPVRSLTLPKIEICPTNAINYTIRGIHDKLKHLSVVRANSSRKYMSVVLDEMETAFQRLVIMSPGMKPFLFRPRLRATEVQEQLFNITFATDQFVQECSFGNHEPCMEFVEKIIDMERGVCWMIDMPTELAQQIKPERGLRLLIDIHPELGPDKQPPVVDGVYIKVSERFNFFESVFTVAQPGTYTKLSLKKETQHLIDVQRSKTPQRCTDSTLENHHGFSVLRVPYGRVACEADCHLKHVLKECDCVMLADVRILGEWLEHAKVCNQTEYESCAMDSVETFRDEIKNCTVECHVACDQTDYQVQSSALSFPSIALLHLEDQSQKAQPIFTLEDTHPGPTTRGKEKLKWVSGTKRWKKAYVLLDISFSRLQVMEYVQSPSTSLLKVISDIGGNVGLWLGASMFTLIQFGALLVNWFYSQMNRLGNGKADDTPSSTVGRRRSRYNNNRPRQL